MPPLLTLFAQVDFTGIAGLLVPIGLVVVIPAIAILTAHQRKMAEIMRGRTSDAPEVRHEIAALQAQVNDLRNQLHELIVRSDATPAQQPQSPPPLHERING